MTQFKYIGDGHTMVDVTKWQPKQKVREGEIIESDLPASYFIKNRFEIVESKKEKIKVETKDDGKDDITIETKTKKK